MSAAHIAQVTPLHVDGHLERGAEHPGIDRAGAERGVQKPGARTTTSTLRGLLRDDARTRGEFLSLVSS